MTTLTRTHTAVAYIPPTVPCPFTQEEGEEERHDSDDEFLDDEDQEEDSHAFHQRLDADEEGEEVRPP